MSAPTLPFTGFEVVHHGKGKHATVEVLCASCGDRVVVADNKDEQRALALAETTAARNGCCSCSLVAIIAAALDDGHGTMTDEVDAARAVIVALVEHGWRFRMEAQGTVHPRLRQPIVDDDDTQ